MLCRFQARAALYTLALAAVLFCAPPAAAQEDEELTDDAADPVKLFQQAQDVHAKGEQNDDVEQLKFAVQLYDEALKLRPEFPEAEYQKGMALVALQRAPEAEEAFRRAMELRADWALPPAGLGVLLAREGREQEAEALLRRAVKLDDANPVASVALARLLLQRAGGAREAVEVLRQATASGENPTPVMWAALGDAERAAGDAEAALKNFKRALAADPGSVEARLGHADLSLDAGDAGAALVDLDYLAQVAEGDARLALAVAALYGRAGRQEKGRQLLDSLPEALRASDEAQRLRAALVGITCEDTAEARAALEKLLTQDPRNAPALSCLGELSRTTDPQRALDYFRRAAAVEPGNVGYATGYAASLIQLRKFPEAAGILQQVLKRAPDNYAAHANLALALYELKLYKEAIVEYKWVSRARPELGVVYFFIGSAHDHLGEYREALAAYEEFVRRADAKVNGLEIEKVNLRLPSLRNQIKRGEGVKPQKKGA